MLSVSSTLLTIDRTPLLLGVVLCVGVAGPNKSSIGTSISAIPLFRFECPLGVKVGEDAHRDLFL